MRDVAVRYHSEPQGWWAESEDLPGWTAVGASLEELRDLVRSAVDTHVGPDATISERGLPPDHARGAASNR
jgi:predicted RNase H-like HicB family nuclease